MIAMNYIRMNDPSIKPVALCIFRNNDEILVEEFFDAHRRKSYFRPLGGDVSFGEYSWDAVRRGIREELGEDIKNLTFLGPSENINHNGGAPAHELIFMFEGEFVNSEVYQQDELFGVEKDGNTLRAIWKPLKEFRRKKATLYPEGLLELLVD